MSIKGEQISEYGLTASEQANFTFDDVFTLAEQKSFFPEFIYSDHEFHTVTESLYDKLPLAKSKANEYRLATQALVPSFPWRSSQDANVPQLSERAVSMKILAPASQVRKRDT